MCRRVATDLILCICLV